jgi:hypothetical protein
VKLPFDIGLRLLLRLLLPGGVLALGFLPLSRSIQNIANVKISDEVVIAASGILFGILIMLLDMPIYLLLEGRRYWPRWVRQIGIERQRKRLERILRLAECELNPTVQVEYDLIAAQYPLDRRTGKPFAMYPTRLGNLLASFETYPTVKYGLDGVFFWPRLWVSIDKDLREELDSAQAVVDGAIYTCACLLILAFTFISYSLLSWPSINFRWIGVAVSSIAGSRLLYLMSLPRYEQYGELFSAVFDQYRLKLDFTPLLVELDTFMEGEPASRSPRDASRAAWRFLRWHRYRSSGDGNNIVENWQE